jgi:uncharacterized protein YacL
MNKFKLFRKPPKEAWQELKDPNKKVQNIPLWLFTVGYIGCVIGLILGIPVPTARHPNPIPPEDLPVFIPVMIILYFLILAIMKFFDYLRNRRKNRL